MARRATAVSANRMFVIATVLITLVFVLLVSRTFSGQKTALSAPVPTPAYNALADTVATKDSDGDGIPDWEEILLGSDPQDSDQNKNGVLDGQERDQFVKSPAKSTLAYGDTETAPSTLTDAVAQDLMGTYMEAIRNGKKLDADVTEEILARAVTRTESLEFDSATPTTKESLRIVESSEYSINAYIEESKKILEVASTNLPGEYTAMEYIVSGNVEAGVAHFEKSAQGYNTVAQSLLRIAVPEDVVETHLALINALGFYAMSLTHLSALQKDPVFAATGYTSLSSAQSGFYTAMASWARYITAHTQPDVTPETDSTQSEEFE